MLIDYLRKELESRQKKNTSYSIRAFAASLEVDPSTLAKILIGKRKLTFEMAKKITEKISEDDSVKSFLLQNFDDTKAIFTVTDELYTVPNDEKLLELMGRWEFFTILGYLDLNGTYDVKKIAKNVECSEEVVSEIISTLLELEFLENNNGHLTFMTKFMSTSFKQPRESINRVLRENIERAQLKLASNDVVKYADFTGVTITIKKDKFHEAVERIKVFRRSLSAFLSEDDDGDSLYRLNIQFFPLYLKEDEKNAAENP